MAGRRIYTLPILAVAITALFTAPGLAQWPQDKRVNTDPGGYNYSNYPMVARSGDNVYVAWREHKPPGTYDNGSTYFNYSHDGGATWGSQDQRVDLGKVQGSSKSNYCTVACSENYVYAAWQDHRDDPTNNDLPNIYFNHSTDYGVTWESTDQRIDVGVAPNNTVSSYLTLKAYKNNVYICWKDARIGVPRPYVSMSGSYGAAGTWTAPTPVDPASIYYIQGYPVMACSGTTVYVAWEDNRNSNLDIYMNHSNDGGATWDSANVRRVDTDIPTSGDSLYLVIAAAEPGSPDLDFPSSEMGYTSSLHGASLSFGQLQKPGSSKDVYCFWRDYRESQGSFALDVYLNYSSDGGLTWGSPDQRMNTHTAPGTYWVGAPAIAAAGSGVYAVWLDGKDDPSPGTSPYIDDVYVNVSLKHGRVGTFSGPKRMDLGVAAGSISSWDPRVTASWPYVWVAWCWEIDDQVNFYDSLYCSYSTNAGVAWTYSERVDSGGTNLGVENPVLFSRGNRLDAVYYDYRSASMDIFYNGRDF